MRLQAGVCVGLLIIAGLTACSGGGSTDLKPAAVATSAAPITTPTGSIGDAASTSRPALTAAQAKTALVTQADMPTGWTTDTSPDDAGTAQSYSPPRCSVLGSTLTSQTTLARTSFALARGSAAAALAEEIYRPSGITPTQRLSQVRSALSTCSTYSVRSSSGTVKFAVKPLSFPKLAEGTLAVQATVGGMLAPTTDSVVYVATGHEIVRFDAISAGTSLASSDLERLVRLSVSRLT